MADEHQEAGAARQQWFVMGDHLPEVPPDGEQPPQPAVPDQPAQPGDMDQPGGAGPAPDNIQGLPQLEPQQPQQDNGEAGEDGTSTRGTHDNPVPSEGSGGLHGPHDGQPSDGSSSPSDAASVHTATDGQPETGHPPGDPDGPAATAPPEPAHGTNPARRDIRPGGFPIHTTQQRPVPQIRPMAAASQTVPIVSQTLPHNPGTWANITRGQKAATRANIPTPRPWTPEPDSVSYPTIGKPNFHTTEQMGHFNPQPGESQGKSPT